MNIITISGRISSGKSYCANLINEHFGYPIASFGGYLKHYCEKNNLPTDRKTLQDIGENFIQINPEDFLSKVVNHYINDADTIILEGVRHKVILETAKRMSKKTISIFLDADVRSRYDRYYTRDKESDTLKSYDQFILADNHSVELEIESLSSLSNIILDSNTDYSRPLIAELIELKL